MGNPVKQYIITTGIHATAWMLFFLLPIFIVQYSSSRNEPPPMPLLTLPIAYLIAFYTNYFILIDRFLFKRKTVIFLLLNLVLVFVLCTGLYILNEIAPFHGSPSAHKPPHAPSPSLCDTRCRLYYLFYRTEHRVKDRNVMEKGRK